MPRSARLVLTGHAHHITQRGNNRENIFAGDDDRACYLDLLGRHSQLAGLDIAGYCLMSNHVHLVAIPQQLGSLAIALRRAHSEYAQQWNRRNQRSGHLWQNRYYSCVLDRRGFWTALRYVERNPVRAGMVDKAQDWAWSSAREHLEQRASGPLPLTLEEWRHSFTTAEWSAVLEENTLEEEDRLRRDTRNGWAADDMELREAVERVIGRQARPCRSGQPKRVYAGPL
ncbi:MAG TPA: transposase [Solibacterales bacterium]|nr:transposase [Bryobacterales bacterium]